MISKIPSNYKGCCDVKITDKYGNYFVMVDAPNHDMYWIPQDNNCNFFEIDKNDKQTFNIFNQIFDDVKQVDDKYSPTLKNNTITYVSEDRPEESANILKITRDQEKINIEFINNSNPHESWVHRDGKICFCDSGSRVPDVEQVFRKMFLNLAYGLDFSDNKTYKDKGL